MEDDLRVREALAVVAERIPITPDLDEVLERVSERHRAPRRRTLRRRQARWSTHPPARRRTVRVTVAATIAAAAVFALVVALLTTGTSTDGDRPDRVDTGPADTPPPVVPNESEAPDATGWKRLWATGLDRPPSAAVWTGDQLALWGAVPAPGARLVLWPAEPGPGTGTGSIEADADGRGLSAPAPIPATETAFAVWTGTEVVVFDSGAAAAYRPDDDTWRELPAPPDAVARHPTAMVWTGREVVVWGDLDRGQPRADGAAWDPVLGRWRGIAAAPRAVNQGGGVWTGDEMVVVGADLDHNNRTDGSTSAIAQAYDPVADRWRQLPDPPLSPQASVVAFADGQLIAWDYLLDAARYDPAGTADAWYPLPPIPLDMSECYPETIAAGDQVVALYCGEAAVLDVRAARWRPVDLPVPSPDAPVVWDGHRVLVTASTGTDHGLWAADPAMLGTG